MTDKRQQLLDGLGTAVLIPCYNEEITIGKVIDDFHAALPLAEVYVYDNNSTDKTSQVAIEHGATVRCYPLQGKGGTVRQMLRDIDADYYLMVDGDDTYPAESAQSLLRPLIDDEADTVIGDRLSNGSYADENSRAFHGFGNALVKFLIQLIYGFEYEDVMTGYRSFNRIFAECLPILSPGFELETEMSIHAIDKRWRIAQVEIDYRDRPEGSESKLSTFSDGWKVLKAIMSLFKDYKPLTLFTWLAIFCVIVMFIIGIPIAMTYYDTGLVPRIPSLIVSVAFGFSGVLFWVSGLILDTNVKTAHKEYELHVTEVYRRRDTNH